MYNLSTSKQMIYKLQIEFFEVPLPPTVFAIFLAEVSTRWIRHFKTVHKLSSIEKKISPERYEPRTAG